MKLGCFLVIATFTGSFTYYLVGFPYPTSANNRYMEAILMAFLASISMANIHGFFYYLQQRLQFRKSRSSWKDGDPVVISGFIQATRPLTAPFSKVPCCIYEYSVSKYIRRGKNSSLEKHYHGMAATPCSIVTKEGAVKVVGFPMINKSSKLGNALEPYVNAGYMIKNTEFKVQNKSFREAIDELKKLIADKDGSIKEDYRVTYAQEFADYTPELIGKTLQEQRFRLEEKIIPNGAEVTANGKYIANSQAVDVSIGFSSAGQIEIGSFYRVNAKGIRNSIIFIVIFGGAFAAANVSMLKPGYLSSLF